jgi:hypothetical protein
VAPALRGLFDPVAANGLQASYELSLGDDRFRVDVGDGKIEVARGSNAQADATIETDPNTLNSVLWGDRSLAAAKRSHEITIEGDQHVLKEFFRLFPIPNGQSIRTRPLGSRLTHYRWDADETLRRPGMSSHPSHTVRYLPDGAASAG